MIDQTIWTKPYRWRTTHTRIKRRRYFMYCLINIILFQLLCLFIDY